MHLARLQTPLGEMLLAASDHALVGAWFLGQKHFPSFSEAEVRGAPLIVSGGESSSVPLGLAAKEFEDFFAGSLRKFSIPLAPKGTAFQQRIWEALQTIPCGESRSYGQVAALAGAQGAYRAAGAAIGKNPISVIIPCHRALGAKGALTGYAGGLDRKKRLLELEGLAIA